VNCREEKDMKERVCKVLAERETRRERVNKLEKQKWKENPHQNERSLFILRFPQPLLVPRIPSSLPQRHSFMIDAVVAFTRGGEVLWRWKGGSNSKHGSGIGAALATNAPLDALVRSCLLEDRASEASFAWDAPGVGGGAYTLKWSLHNVRVAKREREETEKEKPRCHRSRAFLRLTLD